MNRTKQLFATAFIAIFALTSCDKDDNDNLTAKEKLLTNRDWKITSITRKSQVDPAVDSSILKECTADDRLVFTAGRTFDFKDNANKCDSSIFQYDKGSWSMNPAQTQITLTGGIRSQKWNVVSLNDSIMTLEWMDSIAVNNKVMKKIALKNK